MGCKHNYSYSQGYFFCNKCGHKTYGKSGYNRKSRKIGFIVIGIVFVGIVGLLFMNSNFTLNTYSDIQNVTNTIIPTISSIILEEIVNGSKKEGTKLLENVKDVSLSSPIRIESGFDTSLVEKYIFEFTNDERKLRGISTLSRDSQIDVIARDHSFDMATRDYFEHDSPEGNDPTDRGMARNYECRKDFETHYTYGLGENIALDYTYSSYMTQGIKSSYDWLEDEQALAKLIVDGWMDSSGHRANILEKTYDKIGVGVMISNDESVYSTQNFC